MVTKENLDRDLKHEISHFLVNHGLLITVDFADQTVCGIFSSIKLIVAVRKNLVDLVSHRSCCC